MNHKYDFLFTDNYRVLKLIYDNQRNFNGECFSPITQSEIGKTLNISKMTVNTIIKRLKENDLIYIYKDGKGRYSLTKEAIRLIEKINKEN